MNTLYQLIFNAVCNREEMVKLPPETSEEQVRQIIQDLLLQHPELSWLTDNFHFDEKNRLLTLTYRLTHIVNHRKKRFSISSIEMDEMEEMEEDSCENLRMERCCKEERDLDRDFGCSNSLLPSENVPCRPFSPRRKPGSSACTYLPQPAASSLEEASLSASNGFLSRLFHCSRQEVCASIFAPLEAKANAHLLIELFLHLPGDTEKVIALAQEAQKDVPRRNYITLDALVKKGEKIGVICELYQGSRLLQSYQKTVVWQNKIVRCPFDYLVPEELTDDAIYCKTLFSIGGVPIGEMYFTSRIVANPRQMHTRIGVKKYNKVFISYAHEDYPTVRFIAIAYKAQGINYFLDKDRLRTGDVYEEEIFHFIDTSDLFVLCWSQNAAQSVNVGRERKRALQHAYPQVPREEATLDIRPIMIDPPADFPSDMKDIYHFETV